MSVYLDYNATAPIKSKIRDIIIEVMTNEGNASSVHGYGRRARKYIEDARNQVADLCSVKSNQIIFTSGATESINTVLNSYRDKRVLVSAIEHPAVLSCAPHAEIIPVTSDGVIDIDAYKKLLGEGEPPELVCVMLVNSEIGVIQPVEEISRLAHDHGALFLCDAVQGAGRIDISMDNLGADYMVLSAHKMAGPQGVGALITKESLDTPKFMLGGGQEKNSRAGTYNTAGIAGMGLAAKLAKEEFADYQKIGMLRDELENKIRQLSNNITIYGENSPRVVNTCNVGLKNVPAQTQMMALDLDGVAVSSGSACSSGSFKPSHVLTAMGVGEEDAKSALRISLGWATTSADINAFLESYKNIIERTCQK